VRLFESLIDLCRQYSDATDDSMYIILQHNLQAACNRELLEAAIDEAQTRFGSTSETYQNWLVDFASAFEYAGDRRYAFAQNLWRAYLFGSQNAAEQLWDLYQEIRRVASLNGDRHLPPYWGEWILPMQTFAFEMTKALTRHNEVFNHLLEWKDLLALIEEMPADDDDGNGGYRPGAYTVIGELPFDESTFTAYLAACTRITGSAGHLAVPLQDVFVPLRLVPLADYNHPVDAIRYQTAHYDAPELNAFHTPVNVRELLAHPGIEIGEVLTRHDRVLVLGGMGAGKTTLLRFIALQYATMLLEDPAGGLEVERSFDGSVHYRLAWQLPVYVSLAEYIERCDAFSSLHEFVVRSAAELAHDEAVIPMVQSLIAGGQCLILLDGLDQAATDEQRQALVAAVADAADEWWASGNQVIVTSRVEGYDATPLPSTFTSYLLRPLDREQISAFVLNWKRTLVRLRWPLRSDKDVMRQASTEMWDLLQGINANPRLFALLNNPLLLRMLVEVYQPGSVLPTDKAALYQYIAEALIHEWRLPQAAHHRPTVLAGEVVTLLGELAYWLHTTRPTGTISNHELEQILGNIWSDMHPEATPEQVHEAVGDFIGTLRLHPGVLVELAPQRYGFVYQGLQEYFAARRMVSSFRHAPHRIREHLHNPRWTEVIALAIGFTALSSPDNASDLIETAVLARSDRAVMFGQASSPFESLLKRDLLFAARLLGEGIEARPEVTRTVVEQVTRLWLNGERGSLGRFTLIFDSARRHLIRLDGTSAVRYAFQVVTDHLNIADEYLQAYAVDALTFWPSLYDEAQDALLRMDVLEQPVLVRRAVARALKHLRPLKHEMYRLLVRLTNDLDEQTCALAQEALQSAGSVPMEELNMWLSYLHNGDAVRRRVGLRRLMQIRALPRPAIVELLRLLNDPDEMTRQLAVKTLALVYDLPDDALTTIYRAIADADPPFRAAAVTALARPVTLPDQVLRQLIRWSDDPDPGVRIAAIEALGACQNDDPEILDALLDRLNDGADSVRAAVIDPLVRKGQDHPHVMHMLTHIVADPIDEVRLAVARALAHVRQPDYEQQMILNTLLSDRSMAVREAVLETIGQMEYPGTDVLDHLAGLLRMPEHPIKGLAITAMARQRQLPDWALLALVQTLHDYGNTHGEEIVACLRDHAPLSLDVLHELMDLATPREGEMRYGRRINNEARSYAIEILGYSLDDSTATLRILIDAVQSENSRVRLAAVKGLAHARDIPPDVLDRLQFLLRSDQLEIRCSAGITLGNLIRNLPHLPFESEDLLAVARALAETLTELSPRAAWERESQVQNELLQALSWVVARSRPDLPRLTARSEDTPGGLD